ncbi:MAG: hypothetical protein J6B45_00150 [Clostridia bacterium]|nr:hypothetical protein [Clostridia bacterium]
MIEKRKSIWGKNHDPQLDKELTEAIAKKILTEEELSKEIEECPHKLIECCFSVVDKKRRTVPFFFNEVQRDFIGKLETLGRAKPYFILKGRQQGFTTVITAIQLANAIVKRNFSGFTIADRDDNTKAIFNDKAKAMYNDLPEILKPSEKYNSTNELFFDKLNSSWRVASATSNIGRSRTLSFIHFSEIAFYKCTIADLQKSIVEAATEDAYCIYETTANGFNDAKALWDEGFCNNLFYEWWRTKEYTSTEYHYLNSTDKWLNDRLKVLKEKGLSKEQLAWYAKKYASYIDKSAIKQEYPCTPEEAFIVSGDCVFDKEAIANYLNTFNIGSTLGYFEYKKHLEPTLFENGKPIAYETVIDQIKFIKDPNGYIRIVEEPFCQKEHNAILKKPYVIGADTAGTGQDYFTAKVLDNTNGRCVATLRKQNIDEDLFAEQLFCLGKYYNCAFIGVEINYSRHPVQLLSELGYENLYYQNYSDSVPQHSIEKRYGFLTSSSTRPVIISNLVAVMRDDLKCETDRETLKEMTTFVKTSTGRGEASSGSHDDLVMASAIAHYMRRFFTKEMVIIDTGSDFLENSFTAPTSQSNQFMEW